MRHLAAYLLLQIGGNASPSAADIKKVLGAVGIEADAERLEKLISELEGKDVNALIAEGSSKLASVCVSSQSIPSRYLTSATSGPLWWRGRFFGRCCSWRCPRCCRGEGGGEEGGGEGQSRFAHNDPVVAVSYVVTPLYSPLYRRSPTTTWASVCSIKLCIAS